MNAAMTGLPILALRTTRHCVKERSMSHSEDAIMLLGIIAGWLGPTFTGLAILAIIFWMLYRRYKGP